MSPDYPVNFYFTCNCRTSIVIALFPWGKYKRCPDILGFCGQNLKRARFVTLPSVESAVCIGPKLYLADS